MSSRFLLIADKLLFMSCWLFGTGGIALEYGLAFFAEPQNMVRPNSPEDSETDFVLNFVIN